MATPDKGWTVLLIAGQSGVGKTTLAHELTRHWGIPHAQADDFRMALHQITRPQDCPELHYFFSPDGSLNDDVWNRDPRVLCDALVGIARVVSRALEVVIAHHVQRGLPIILEGDGILPYLATGDPDGLGSAVRYVQLIEVDAEVVLTRQRKRGAEYETQASMYELYGHWLRKETDCAGLPSLDAQPYATLRERVIMLTGNPLAPTGS